LLTGESAGKVQLFEVKNKYILRSYQGKSRVNALCFSQDQRNFAACANDTCLRYYDIQDSSNKCALEIQAAHADNIKQVRIVADNKLISASADRYVKLWDLRSTAHALASFKVENAVEDFCLFDDKIVIA
jgi:WD40 repeat protein